MTTNPSEIATDGSEIDTEETAEMGITAPEVRSAPTELLRKFAADPKSLTYNQCAILVSFGYAAVKVGEGEPASRVVLTVDGRDRLNNPWPPIGIN